MRFYFQSKDTECTSIRASKTYTCRRFPNRCPSRSQHGKAGNQSGSREIHFCDDQKRL